MCASLGARDVAHAVELICCRDQLLDPVPVHEVTPALTHALEAWWGHRMDAPDPHMTEPRYRELLVR